MEHLFEQAQAPSLIHSQLAESQEHELPHEQIPQHTLVDLSPELSKPPETKAAAVRHNKTAIDIKVNLDIFISF